MTRLEKETVILFNEEEANASVYTYNGKLQKRLQKLQFDHPDSVSKDSEDNTGAVTYTVPKSWIKINPKRVMSEQQKQFLANRLSEYR